MNEILNIYRKRFTDSEIFYHLMERLELHITKLKKLKKEDNKEILLRETADVYLLSKALLELENVSEETITKSYDYYLSKIKKLFNNNNNQYILSCI